MHSPNLLHEPSIKWATIYTCNLNIYNIQGDLTLNAPFAKRVTDGEHKDAFGTHGHNSLILASSTDTCFFGLPLSRLY
jgi:hypothetical protein